MALDDELIMKDIIWMSRMLKDGRFARMIPRVLSDYLSDDKWTIKMPVQNGS